MDNKVILVLALGLATACAPEGARDRPLGYRDLLAEANAAVTALAPLDAMELLPDSMVAFVDLREQNEIDQTGTIPGAIQAPRGMLEFYIDPESGAHLSVFSSGKRIVFYCAGGGRSALATLTAQRMGLSNVAHLSGGIRAWIDAGGPLEPSPAAAL